MAARESVAARWISREMVLLLIVLATLPLWIGPIGLYQYLGIEIAIWMIYGLGFNLLLGYSGLPSFGHGAFFGVGAYAFGLFQLHVFESLLLGIACAVAAGFVAGAIVACFLSHRRGIYFALMTIAFGQVFWFIAIKWHAITGGEDGLLNIPRPALEHIDLRFEAGRLSGIMGPNGAGKTTCFNVLTGRFKPDRGRVVFDDEDITGLSPNAIARRDISRSFQIMSLFDEYSTLENVLIALPEVRERGFNMVDQLAADSAAADRASVVLARVGLAGREHRRAADLAYGERRALEIGVALAAEPRLLFLDEPTSGLGTEATARLADLVQGLKRDYSIVVIEHDMAFLFGLADTISVIHWGQVIASGTPQALRENKWVQRSNLGGLA